MLNAAHRVSDLFLFSPGASYTFGRHDSLKKLVETPHALRGKFGYQLRCLVLPLFLSRLVLNCCCLVFSTLSAVTLVICGLTGGTVVLSSNHGLAMSEGCFSFHFARVFVCVLSLHVTYLCPRPALGRAMFMYLSSPYICSVNVSV